MTEVKKCPFNSSKDNTQIRRKAIIIPSKKKKSLSIKEMQQ